MATRSKQGRWSRLRRRTKAAIVVGAILSLVFTVVVPVVAVVVAVSNADSETSANTDARLPCSQAVDKKDNILCITDAEVLSTLNTVLGISNGKTYNRNLEECVRDAVDVALLAKAGLLDKYADRVKTLLADDKCSLSFPPATAADPTPLPVVTPDTLGAQPSATPPPSSSPSSSPSPAPPRTSHSPAVPSATRAPSASRPSSSASSATPPSRSSSSPPSSSSSAPERSTAPAAPPSSSPTPPPLLCLQLPPLLSVGC